MNSDFNLTTKQQFQKRGLPRRVESHDLIAASDLGGLAGCQLHHPLSRATAQWLSKKTTYCHLCHTIGGMTLAWARNGSWPCLLRNPEITHTYGPTIDRWLFSLQFSCYRALRNPSSPALQIGIGSQMRETLSERWHCEMLLPQIARWIAQLARPLWQLFRGMTGVQKHPKIYSAFSSMSFRMWWEDTHSFKKSPGAGCLSVLVDLCILRAARKRSETTLLLALLLPLLY